MADPNGRTALLAGVCWGSLLLIKQEGQVWLLALGLALAGTIFLRRTVFSWKTLTMSVYAIAPALGCAAIALVNRRGIPESPYFRSFGQALRWDWLVHVWKRPFFLVQFALRGIASPRSFGYCWQLTAVALVFLRRPRVTATVLFWRLMTAAVIAGYFLVLTITPLHFEYQLRTALFRLAIHFLPLVLLIGAEQLAAAGWTRQIQSIFDGESSANEDTARTDRRATVRIETQRRCAGTAFAARRSTRNREGGLTGMNSVSEPTIKTEIPGRNRRRARQFLRIGVLLAVLYLLAAYLVAPAAWRLAAHFHPALAKAPHVTHTKDGIPGDPLNIALIGTEEELSKAMHVAGWQPADPITLKSSLRIVGDSVLRRPYDDAPVSNLYLWGRVQDLAFEQPIGDDPRKRNHVRFWKSAEVGPLGNPMWFGAATMDIRVGLSHTTGQVTHHIEWRC